MRQSTTSSELNSFSLEELREVMFDRLHDHQSVGPPIDPRGDYPAYLWLVEQYRVGTDGLRDRMTVVVDEFVSDLTDATEWPREARVNLLDLAQECRMDLNAVKTLIRSGELLGVEGARRDAHASLLKSSLAVGHRYSPDFWLEQLDLLGDDYGALIFGGLLEHGLDTAAQYLRLCCALEDAIAHMDLFMPALVDTYGLEAVRSAIEPQLDNVSPEARTRFRQVLLEEGVLSAAQTEFDEHLLALGRDPDEDPESDTWQPAAISAINDGLVLATQTALV